jgi:hypothetical protein
MTNGVPGPYIMITAVIISVLIMMQFAVPVGNFVNTHPSIQILGYLFNLNRFHAYHRGAFIKCTCIWQSCYSSS